MRPGPSGGAAFFIFPASSQAATVALAGIRELPKVLVWKLPPLAPFPCQQISMTPPSHTEPVSRKEQID
jgi:hypothetical protein